MLLVSLRHNFVASSARIAKRDIHTNTHTHKPNTVSLVAYAHRGLTMHTCTVGQLHSMLCTHSLDTYMYEVGIPTQSINYCSAVLHVCINASCIYKHQPKCTPIHTRTFYTVQHTYLVKFIQLPSVCCSFHF